MVVFVELKVNSANPVGRTAEHRQCLRRIYSNAKIRPYYFAVFIFRKGLLMFSALSGFVTLFFGRFLFYFPFSLSSSAHISTLSEYRSDFYHSNFCSKRNDPKFVIMKLWTFIPWALYIICNVFSNPTIFSSAWMKKTK